MQETEAGAALLQVAATAVCGPAACALCNCRYVTTVFVIDKKGPENIYLRFLRMKLKASLFR